MNITINFLSFPHKVILAKQIRLRSKKLQKYLAEIISIEWFFHLGHDRYHVTVEMRTPHHFCYAKTSSKSSADLIDDILKKLKRQLLRHKEKIRSHRCIYKKSS